MVVNDGDDYECDGDDSGDNDADSELIVMVMMVAIMMIVDDDEGDDGYRNNCDGVMVILV
jgi:hypothetical protein